MSLKKILMSEEVAEVIELIREIVRSHSIQNFASTHSRRSGCSRDDLNMRGQ